MTNDWNPLENPVTRPHEPECPSFPDGCCTWMSEPCACQCICDVLISAYKRGVDVSSGGNPNLMSRHEMGVMIARLSNRVFALEDTIESMLKEGDEE